MNAARAAAAELSHLTGDQLREQHYRVQELLEVATHLNEEIRKKNPAAGSMIHSARPTAGKSAGQASSPHVGRGNPVVSARNKQMQVYDPAVAGKQVIDVAHVDQNAGHAAHGNQPIAQAGQGPVAPRVEVVPQAGQNFQVPAQLRKYPLSDSVSSKAFQAYRGSASGWVR